MEFVLEPIIVTGYHGSTRKVAQQIVDDDFVASLNDWDWLGHGVYFWQDAPERAYRWAERRILDLGLQEPAAVVAARIHLNGFVDMLDQRGMTLLQDLARSYQRQHPSSSLANKSGANRLDCAVFNFATSMLSWLGVGVAGYRAACVEGNALTPGSPIFDLSHVQLVVVNREAILEKWIVQTHGKVKV